jgi:hypothetical protein
MLYFIAYHVLFVPQPYCFSYMVLQINLKSHFTADITILWYVHFCYFYSGLLWIFGSLFCLHMVLCIDFYNSVKMMHNFSWGLHSINRFILVISHFHNINSADPWTCYVFSSSLFISFFLQGITMFIVELYHLLC